MGSERGRTAVAGRFEPVRRHTVRIGQTITVDDSELSPADGPGRDGRARPGGGASPLVVGWKEWVGLPELGVDWIKAKMDTGARSSALHAWDVEAFEEDGVPMVSFELHPWQDSMLDAIRLARPLVDERRVRSSTGHEQDRFVISTELRIGAFQFTTEITLTNRDSMGLRMLIGRQAMSDRLLVDSSSTYLAGHPPREVRRRNRQTD